MIPGELYLPRGAIDLNILGGTVTLQKLDIAAAVDRARSWSPASRCSSRRRASVARCARWPTIIRRRCRSASRSTRSGSIVWFAAGIVALATGIMWGARSEVSFALQVVALKALPVLILGGFTSMPGAIVGGLIIGIGEKLGEFYWGPLVGGGIERWLAYAIALAFLLFTPAGPVRREDHRADLIGARTDVFYREAGQFKTSYAADMAIFPIRQDRIGLALILLVAFVVIPAIGDSSSSTR